MENLRREEDFRNYRDDDEILGEEHQKASKGGKLVSLLLAVLIVVLMFNLIQPLFSPQTGGEGGRAAALTKSEKEELEEYKARYGRVETVRKHLIKNYYKDIDESKFQEGMIRGMLRTLDDPYTVYFNEKEFKMFNESSAGKYDSWEWNFGKSPAYNMSNKKRWDGGTLEVRASVEKGLIKEIYFYGDFLARKPINEILAVFNDCPFKREDVGERIKKISTPEYFGSITPDEILQTIFL